MQDWRKSEWFFLAWLGLHFGIWCCVVVVMVLGYLDLRCGFAFMAGWLACYIFTGQAPPPGEWDWFNVAVPPDSKPSRDGRRPTHHVQ